MLHELSPMYVVQVPEVKDMEEGILYISMRYKTVIHLCACGCGHQTVTPLSQGWTLLVNADKVTLRPSIGNQKFPCGSHYYITDNKVEWL